MHHEATRRAHHAHACHQQTAEELGVVSDRNQ